MNLNPLHQLEEKLLFRLMKVVDPQLLGIPFQKPHPAQCEIDYVLRAVMEYINSRLFRRFIQVRESVSKPTHDYRFAALENNRKRWFSPLLENSDFEDSFQIVDRNVLERLIYDDHQKEYRRHHYANLFGLLTCWAFFRSQD